MTKRLTITLSDEVYEGLRKRVGRRKISRFIEAIARERLTDSRLPDDWSIASDRQLAAAYSEQAAYEETRAGELKEQDEAWLNGLIADVLRSDGSNAKG